MPDRPVTDVADLLQTFVTVHVYRLSLQRLGQVTHRILLHYQGLQKTVDRQVSLVFRQLAIAAVVGFDGAMRLANGIEGTAKLVPLREVPAQLLLLLAPVFDRSHV